MEAILLVVHVLIAVGLIGIVLIQRSSTDGFGLGNGSGANLLSGRQTANLLTRTTAILAALFIGNSLLLGVLAANRGGVSLVDQIEAVSGQVPSEVSPDATPEVEEPADENAVPMVPEAGDEAAPVKAAPKNEASGVSEEALEEVTAPAAPEASEAEEVEASEGETPVAPVAE